MAEWANKNKSEEHGNRRSVTIIQRRQAADTTLHETPPNGPGHKPKRHIVGLVVRGMEPLLIVNVEKFLSASSGVRKKVSTDGTEEKMTSRPFNIDLDSVPAIIDITPAFRAFLFSPAKANLSTLSQYHRLSRKPSPGLSLLARIYLLALFCEVALVREGSGVAIVRRRTSNIKMGNPMERSSLSLGRDRNAQLFGGGGARPGLGSTSAEKTTATTATTTIVGLNYEHVAHHGDLIRGGDREVNTGARIAGLRRHGLFPGPRASEPRMSAAKRSPFPRYLERREQSLPFRLSSAQRSAFDSHFAGPGNRRSFVYNEARSHSDLRRISPRLTSHLVIAASVDVCEVGVSYLGPCELLLPPEYVSLLTGGKNASQAVQGFLQVYSASTFPDAEQMPVRSAKVLVKCMEFACHDNESNMRSEIGWGPPGIALGIEDQLVVIVPGLQRTKKSREAPWLSRKLLEDLDLGFRQFDCLAFGNTVASASNCFLNAALVDFFEPLQERRMKSSHPMYWLPTKSVSCFRTELLIPAVWLLRDDVGDDFNTFGEIYFIVAFQSQKDCKEKVEKKGDKQPGDNRKKKSRVERMHGDFASRRTYGCMQTTDSLSPAQRGYGLPLHAQTNQEPGRDANSFRLGEPSRESLRALGTFVSTAHVQCDHALGIPEQKGRKFAVGNRRPTTVERGMLARRTV
ncbi:hypothetical protein M413DRAFT_14405 [Hebeloma cylindrosporum]|uniref:Uncharacterized protein n=1 Tax=Hebeloma cylindrosporum TaxID=76867 RepID=A0A0C3BW87_HEBCY|nr:hypothetical protein M413DRAFT_14405 [Hebeloma cylindrosporum h7]